MGWTEHLRAPCLTLFALLPVQQAAAHDWYEGLMSPSGFSCCDEQDCHAVPYRLNTVTGEEEVKVNGQWWPIQQRNILPLASPDGKVHVCWDQRFRPSQQPTFRCIILPRTSSLAVAAIG